MTHDRSSMTLSMPGGEDVEIAYRDTGGPGECVVFLHGLGSDSHDFILFDRAEARRSFRLVALDLPGHGGSKWPDDRQMTVDIVVELVDRFVKRLSLDAFHLIGHSLGGVIGLRLAHRRASSIRSFINIEGNLVPEDCGVLSRDGREKSSRLDPERYFNRLTASLIRSPLAGHAEYARRFRSVLSGARPWFDYCESLVTLSDDHDLLGSFLTLHVPRAYIYGDQNKHAFLDRLDAAGIEAVSIAGSGHWPMYSNPRSLADSIRRLLDRFALRQRRMVSNERTFNPLELAKTITADYSNVDLACVNDHVLRMSVMHGAFRWHKHPDSDEMFMVLEGEFHIEMEEGTRVLHAGDCFVVSRGKLHRTRAVGRAVNLTIEHEGTLPGGSGG